MFDPALKAIFDRQYGLITRSQAIEHSMTNAKIRYRVSSGEWVRVHYGIYRHVLVPNTFRTALMLGVLATGGVVSHRSAARLHRLEELGRRSTKPEISVAHGRWRPVDGVVVHQTTQIDRFDILDADGLPITGRGRTVLDLGASMRAGWLGKVVDDLLRKKLITQGELWDVLIRHSVQGRNGCGPLRTVLELRLGQERLALSDWSYSVANLLEAAGLPRPALEFRAHTDDGRFIAQTDLAYPSAMLAIELDSVSKHNNLDSFHSDRTRARGLTVEGWHVLQYTWKDYTNTPDQLVAEVRGILSRESVTQ